MAEARLSGLPEQRRVLRRAWPFLRRRRLALAGVIVLELVGAGLAVAVTATIGRIVGAAGNGDRDGVLGWSLALAVMVVVGGVVTWQARYRIVEVGELVLAGVRERATEAVARAPLRFLEAHRRGDLLRRLTGEINGLGAFVGGTLPDLVTATTVLAVTVLMLVVLSWPLTILLLVGFVPVAVVIVGRFKRAAGPAYGELSEAEAAVAASFAESLPAQEQLRVSGGVARWLGWFARANDRLLAAERNRVRAELRLNLLALLQAAAVGGIVVAGAALIDAGLLSVGVAVVFVLASRDIVNRFEDLAASIGDAREAQVRLARVLELIQLCGDANPSPGTGATEFPGSGALTLAGVDFGYPAGPPVLANLSLTVAPGDHLVIAGETGSGKSTLGKLVAGLYRPASGTVNYAGVDLAAADPVQVRERIVLVPQEVVLVEGSVAENMAMVPGRPGRLAVEAALDRLGLTAWAASLPDGLDTGVGRHGARLSAGERQLVAIARAALADPAVLILDEATADVDPVTAARIEQTLAAASDQRTLIVIAHRADTIARGRLLLRMPEARLSDGAGRPMP
ncbi:ABC transporter ATP-binding protein [Actinomadura syzygii]|uniref:ABC transporter ATP-binding protein n=1 Tax=Actinomadura syzygii TaxID=1427538 RepID=A0A5D0TNC3_9ACTN|nr:ABC transporter ATP-binding protein [Actinomadura syzygii]TYC07618.1 ABC transporter ATP-binding protein [Actinomadura syzygii]